MRNESMTLYDQEQATSIRFASEDMKCRILRFYAPPIEVGATVLFADVLLSIGKYEDSDGILHINPHELTVKHIRLVKHYDEYEVELPDEVTMDSILHGYLKSTLTRCYEEHFEYSII